MEKVRSLRQEQAAHTAELRARGWTWVQIAEDFRTRYRVNARVAFRLAHGWSQREAADQWNSRWPGDLRSLKNFSSWELWPSSTGHAPSLETLDRLAMIYQCSIADLLADCGDHRKRDPAWALSAQPSGWRVKAEPVDGGLQWLASGKHADTNPALDDLDSTPDSVPIAASVGGNDRGWQAPVTEALQVVASGPDGLSAATETLDELIGYYAHAVQTRAPAEVYDGLLGVRSLTSTILNRSSRSRQRADVIVCAGWLSNLLAITSNYLGDNGAALVWCVDAERRSKEAGHPELAGWAAMTRSVLAYYHDQPARSAQVAAAGLRHAPSGTAVHTRLAAQLMRARAWLGDTDGVRQARTLADSSITRLPPSAETSGVFSVPLAQHPPYTATSMLLTGQPDQAAAVTEELLHTIYQPRTLDGSQPSTNYARTLLILGLARAGTGDLDGAAAAGHAALEIAPTVWPTLALAGRLDHTLQQRAAGAAASADYHARYRATQADRMARPTWSEDGHGAR
ncbi:MAG: hypothetical protein L0Y54_18835 [Sporichthyaceae bacterium]|nr:hypothetical protein [Sporichthyaceae bacterium]